MSECRLLDHRSPAITSRFRCLFPRVTSATNDGALQSIVIFDDTIYATCGYKRVEADLRRTKTCGGGRAVDLSQRFVAFTVLPSIHPDSRAWMMLAVSSNSDVYALELSCAENVSTRSWVLDVVLVLVIGSGGDVVAGSAWDPVITRDNQHDGFGGTTDLIASSETIGGGIPFSAVLDEDCCNLPASRASPQQTRQTFLIRLLFSNPRGSSPTMSRQCLHLLELRVSAKAFSENRLADALSVACVMQDLDADGIFTDGVGAAPVKQTIRCVGVHGLHWCEVTRDYTNDARPCFLVIADVSTNITDPLTRYAGLAMVRDASSSATKTTKRRGVLQEGPWLVEASTVVCPSCIMHMTHTASSELASVSSAALPAAAEDDVFGWFSLIPSSATAGMALKAVDMLVHGAPFGVSSVQQCGQEAGSHRSGQPSSLASPVRCSFSLYSSKGLIASHHVPNVVVSAVVCMKAEVREALKSPSQGSAVARIAALTLAGDAVVLTVGLQAQRAFGMRRPTSSKGHSTMSPLMADSGATGGSYMLSVSLRSLRTSPLPSAALAPIYRFLVQSRCCGSTAATANGTTYLTLAYVATSHPAATSVVLLTEKYHSTPVDDSAESQSIEDCLMEPAALDLDMAVITLQLDREVVFKRMHRWTRSDPTLLDEGVELSVVRPLLPPRDRLIRCHGIPFPVQSHDMSGSSKHVIHPDWCAQHPGQAEAGVIPAVMSENGLVWLQNHGRIEGFALPVGLRCCMQRIWMWGMGRTAVGPAAALTSAVTLQGVAQAGIAIVTVIPSFSSVDNGDVSAVGLEAHWIIVNTAASSVCQALCPPVPLLPHLRHATVGIQLESLGSRDSMAAVNRQVMMRESAHAYWFALTVAFPTASETQSALLLVHGVASTSRSGGALRVTEAAVWPQARLPRFLLIAGESDGPSNNSHVWDVIHVVSGKVRRLSLWLREDEGDRDHSDEAQFSLDGVSTPTWIMGGYQTHSASSQELTAISENGASRGFLETSPLVKNLAQEPIFCGWTSNSNEFVGLFQFDSGDAIFLCSPRRLPGKPPVLTILRFLSPKGIDPLAAALFYRRQALVPGEEGDVVHGFILLPDTVLITLHGAECICSVRLRRKCSNNNSADVVARKPHISAWCPSLSEHVEIFDGVHGRVVAFPAVPEVNVVLLDTESAASTSIEWEAG